MIQLEVKGIENLLDYFNSLDVEKALNRGIRKSMITIENETKRATPVDTGLLRNSFENTINGLSGELNNFREYAPFVQFGTRYIRGVDFLGKGVDGAIPLIQNIFNKEVDDLLRTL